MGSRVHQRSECRPDLTRISYLLSRWRRVVLSAKITTDGRDCGLTGLRPRSHITQATHGTSSDIEHAGAKGLNALLNRIAG